MSEIKFKIDGHEMTAVAGETIFQIAVRNGINIPTQCYNRKVSLTTSCFVCVVKDKKTGRFLPSCSTCPIERREIES